MTDAHSMYGIPVVSLICVVENYDSHFLECFFLKLAIVISIFLYVIWLSMTFAVCKGKVSLFLR